MAPPGDLHGDQILQARRGKDIATEVLSAVVRYLCDGADTEIISASTMVENRASANALRKNGLSPVVSAVEEDWGYTEPTLVDKWIR